MGLQKELKLPGAKRKVGGILNGHLKQINQWLIEGYTKKQVFEYLKKEDIIDCSYNHFVATINKLITGNNETSETIYNSPISSNVPQKKGFKMMRLGEDDFK